MISYVDLGILLYRLDIAQDLVLRFDKCSSFYKSTHNVSCIIILAIYCLKILDKKRNCVV